MSTSSQHSAATRTTASQPGAVQARQETTAPAESGEIMVSVRDALKTYGAVHALDGVSLQLERGKFLVLLGPSGSGKSTLLRALSGIERLDGGSIAIAGREVSSSRRMVAPEKRDLGMVFQDYALWPHMTVAANVGYALRRRSLGRGEARERVNTMLERVGLAGYGDRFPNQLSGGQQQRVSLARALVGNPSLVLFDEPLSNLDADLRERLRLQISTLTRELGATAVYITHDQSEAFALADEIGVLNEGRFEQYGHPEDIYNRPASPFVAEFTGIAGRLDGTLERHFDERYGLVAVHGGQLTVRLDPGAVDGQPVSVFVRPDATHIVGRPDMRPEQLEAEAKRVGRNLLTGHVIDVAYRGRGYDHVLEGPWGALSGVAGREGRQRGDECLLSVSQDGAIAFARDASGAGATSVQEPGQHRA